MEKILLIRLSALGDIIHALPVAQVLKGAGKEVGWVVSDKFEKLVKESEFIDKVFVMPLSKWRRRWLSPLTWFEIYKFTGELRRENYEIALDLHGMFKSAVVLAFCGAKRRITYKDVREGATLAANEFVEPKSTRPHRNYHVIERHFDMLRHIGPEVDSAKFFEKMREIYPECGTEGKKHADELLSDLKKGLPTVAIAPATTWVNKHWKEERWQKLISECEKFANVILTGGKGDKELLKRVCRGTGAKILAGETTLDELAEVFRRCDVVISPDSGSAHLAWAVCKPVVITIFCATSAQTFKPRGVKHTALPEKPVCEPCHKRKCGRGDEICREAVEVGEVLEAVKGVLKVSN